MNKDENGFTCRTTLEYCEILVHIGCREEVSCRCLESILKRSCKLIVEGVEQGDRQDGERPSQIELKLMRGEEEGVLMQDTVDMGRSTGKNIPVVCLYCPNSSLAMKGCCLQHSTHKSQRKETNDCFRLCKPSH